MCNFALLKRLVTSGAIVVVRVVPAPQRLYCVLNQAGLVVTRPRSPPPVSLGLNESLVRFIRDVHEKKFAGLPFPGAARRGRKIARRNFICVVRRPARRLKRHFPEYLRTAIETAR